MKRDDGTDQAGFTQQLHDTAARLRSPNTQVNSVDVEELAKMLDKAATIIELYRVRYAANDRVTIDAEANEQAKMEGTYPPRARHTGFSDR